MPDAIVDKPSESVITSGPLHGRCHGYPNGCICERCWTRAHWFATFQAQGFSFQEASDRAHELARGARYL